MGASSSHALIPKIVSLQSEKAGEVDGNLLIEMPNAREKSPKNSPRENGTKHIPHISHPCRARTVAGVAEALALMAAELWR
jgi:hypothetical protein